jgi:copper chaperone CopZ
MRPIHVAIVGMTCAHCVRAVRNRLAATPGVEVDDVQIGTADIRFDPSKISTSEIEDAISDEGYTVDAFSEVAR